MSLIRRAAYALQRSFWDALDAMGSRIFFAALSAVALAVLTLVCISPDDGLASLRALAAVLGVFVAVTCFKFVQAFATPSATPTR
ncbi:hypothetical protein BH18ACT12_BH18ACT12_01420 [soil metagenome]